MATLAGCTLASDPARISPDNVSPEVYQDYDCDRLARRIVDLGYRIEDLQAWLKSRHRTDEWQLVTSWFYGISALYIEGDGPEVAEFRQLHGEFEAARVQAGRKSCGFEASSRQQTFQEARASLRRRTEPPPAAP